MKRLLLFLCVLFSGLSSLTTTPCFASTSETYFAKVSFESVYFYSLPINSEAYQLFEIPSSYYVLLLDSENNDFYRAKYSNIEGYVLKNSVQPINETPNYPYAMSSFRVFSSTQLQSQPSISAESLTTLSPLEEITSFYGEKVGQELIPDSTNVWYYCSYLADGVLKYGYIFSYYCDHFQKILPNNELFTPVTTDIFVKEEPPIFNSSQGLTSTAKALIAVGCCVPCLIIILLLLKKRSIRPAPAKRTVKKPRRDFYEFNEDDI